MRMAYEPDWLERSGCSRLWWGWCWSWRGVELWAVSGSERKVAWLFRRALNRDPSVGAWSVDRPAAPSHQLGAGDLLAGLEGCLNRPLIGRRGRGDT